MGGVLGVPAAGQDDHVGAAGASGGRSHWPDRVPAVVDRLGDEGGELLGDLLPGEVAGGQESQPAAGDALRQVLAVGYRYQRVVGRCEDVYGHPDPGQQVAQHGKLLRVAANVAGGLGKPAVLVRRDIILPDLGLLGAGRRGLHARTEGGAVHVPEYLDPRSGDDVCEGAGHVERIGCAAAADD